MFADFHYLAMEGIISTASGYIPHANYDLTRGEGDMQRYFIYKTIEEDGVKKLKGECRKCGQSLSRAGSSTTNMINHEEKCDNEAWKVYKAASKSRKSKSAPSTPQSNRKPQQLKIDSAFTVNYF